MLPSLLLSLVLAQPPIGAAVEKPAPVGVPTLELDPPQVMVSRGSLFKLRAKTNATKAFFDTEGVQEAPADWPLNDRKTCFYGQAPSVDGTFTISVTVFAGEERVIRKCLVIVGSSPIPPNPPPGPAPGPNDPLVASLQKAFEADGKRVDVRDRLIRLWLDAAADVVENEERKTLLEFRQAKAEASKHHPYNLGPNDLLRGCRTAIGDELKALCGGTESCPLGKPQSDLRVKIKALLERYATALAQVK